MSALRVRVVQDRESLPQFLVRLCASVGGLCATSHLLCLLVKAAIEFYCCKKKKSKEEGEGKPRYVPGPDTGAVPKRPTAPPQQQTEPLLNQ